MIARTILALGACAVTGYLLSSLKLTTLVKRQDSSERDEARVPLFV